MGNICVCVFVCVYVCVVPYPVLRAYSWLFDEDFQKYLGNHNVVQGIQCR